MAGDLKRRIKSLRRKAEQLPEMPLDFSGVPSEVLYKIAYGELDEDEIDKILQEYSIAKSGT